MSDEDITPEEEAELRRIANVYAAAAQFSSFLMKNMDEGNIGLACDDEKIVMEFAKKFAVLVKHLSGSENEPEFHLESEPEDNSSSGGSEPDSRQESGELRPSNRKLH